MQERFSLCWAAVHSLNVSSSIAGNNDLTKHPAAECMTRKTEPKRQSCKAGNGIQDCIIT